MSSQPRDVQIRLPCEITEMIFFHLPNSTLKNVRLVCHDFSEMSKPILFQVVTVSARLCHIRRLKALCEHPDISQYVRCIIYQEMDKLTSYTWPNGIFFGLDPDMTIDDYIAKPTIEWYGQDCYEGDSDPEEYSRPDEAESCRQALRRRFEKFFCNHAGCGIVSKYLVFMALRQALKCLPRLRTLVSRERKESCQYATALADTLLSCYPQDCLQDIDPELEEWIPLKRWKHSRHPIDENDGFYGMCAALSANPGNQIENIVTERTSGFLKRGIQYGNWSSRLSPTHPLNLRSVNLCVDVPQITQETTGDRHCFPAFLANSPRLKHLHLSFTYNHHRRSVSMPVLPDCEIRIKRLESLVLEYAALSGRRLTVFIRAQRKSLKHLVLWKCCLVGSLSWKNVVDLLAAMRLNLDTFILKTPTDHPIRVRYRTGFVGSRVDNDILLQYINSGGEGTNPFDEQVWHSVKRDEETSGSESSDDDGQTDPPYQPEGSPLDQEMIDVDEDGTETAHQPESPIDQEMSDLVDIESGSECQSESEGATSEYSSGDDSSSSYAEPSADGDSSSDSGASSDDNSLVDVEEDRMLEIRSAMEAEQQQSNRPPSTGNNTAGAFFREMWAEVDQLR